MVKGKRIKKVLLVFGTRPEAIKMAPLVKEFEKFPDIFDVKVCVTAQHREMLDQVLKIFNVIPDFDLDIMAPNQDLFDITSRVMLGLRDVLKMFNPDVVLVHGDTTTSIATALAAFYLQIKIGHIEAGLRTYNLNSPWPEEMNRQVTDVICDYYFAPTETSKQNLLNEKIPVEKIIVTGNTVIDALFMAVNLLQNNPLLCFEIENSFNDKGFNIVNSIKNKRSYILVTGHRRENFGEGFMNICKAIKSIALEHPELDIIYPVHLNPNVQKPVFDLLSNLQNVFLIPPVDYLPFVYLMKHCKLVLTDSGGLQEEAPSLGKPVLVMRNTTERPEAVLAGTVKLVGTDFENIVANLNLLLGDSDLFSNMSNAYNPYGNGEASKHIVDFFIQLQEY